MRSLRRPILTVILLAAGLCGAAARASDTSDAVAAAQGAAAAASVAASSALAAAKSAALSASAAAAVAPAEPVLTFVPQLTLWFVLGVFVFGVGVPIKKLSSNASGWSLTDALSEKAAAPAPVAVVQAAVAVVPAGAVAPAPAPATPDPVTTGTASASRLVAFLGTIAILAMFMGFGLYAIWAAFNGRATEARDTLKAVSSYLLYGSAMYAPYAFNQIKAAFSS